MEKLEELRRRRSRGAGGPEGQERSRQGGRGEGTRIEDLGKIYSKGNIWDDVE